MVENEGVLSKGFDLKALDDAISAKNWLLRFPPKLEAAFERDTGWQRCHELIVRAYIGIAIYDLFAFADWWATPELFWTTLWVRLAFFTPVSLLLVATLYTHPKPFFRESIICIGGGAIATWTIIYLMAISGKTPQATLHESMTLVVLFLTVVQRTRFSYLAPTCFAFLVVHVFAVAHFYEYSLGQQVAINMVFGGTVIFALVASYTMERDVRLHYLLSLRDRAQNLELDRMSRRDPLTGLGNRRFLEETLATCEEVSGSREPLSIVLLDIDHFKLFNDTAGHQAGDLCLKRVAGILQAELRGQADHAFRFGGEELIVVLPRAVLPKAIGIAERIRQAIEGAAIPHPALAAGSVVTASFGVACSRAGHKVRAVEVVADADAALYTAKRNGRNQVWPRPFPASELTEHKVVTAAG
ncbi:MAG TPA: GGDEF domain-containing protein [Bradyrhizobium sp.]|nr:GGDEF domain-containing protein [Bradyrhizobium sp.]